MCGRKKFIQINTDVNVKNGSPDVMASYEEADLPVGLLTEQFEK